MLSQHLRSLVRRLAPFVLALALVLGAVQTALAQRGGSFNVGNEAPIGLQRPNAVPGNFSNVTRAIQTIFNVVIAAAGAIFVVLLLVGGIRYLTSAGNEDETGKAKRLLVDAIIGLVIVLAAWAIGNFVLDRLGVQRGEDFNF